MPSPARYTASDDEACRLAAAMKKGSKTMAAIAKPLSQVRIADYVGSKLASAAKAWEMHKRYRATVAGLEALSERELADIGLTRDQIRSVARDASNARNR